MYKMTETILIGIHRTEIKKGVASVLSWFEGRGSKKFSAPFLIFFYMAPQTTILDPPLVQCTYSKVVTRKVFSKLRLLPLNYKAVCMNIVVLHTMYVVNSVPKNSL